MIDKGQRHKTPVRLYSNHKSKTSRIYCSFSNGQDFREHRKVIQEIKPERYVSKLDAVQRYTLEKSYAYNQKGIHRFSLTRETLEIKRASH